jgi:hypothetical protein
LCRVRDWTFIERTPRSVNRDGLDRIWSWTELCLPWFLRDVVGQELEASVMVNRKDWRQWRVVDWRCGGSLSTSIITAIYKHMYWSTQSYIPRYCDVMLGLWDKQYSCPPSIHRNTTQITNHLDGTHIGVRKCICLYAGLVEVNYGASHIACMYVCTQNMFLILSRTMHYHLFLSTWQQVMYDPL